ncbi:MAG TPA: hypothetical protein VFL55_14950 [Acetobacteraceae bacterium]|nr:hypothetical protein [Acetobacteraceae bacterium]
MRVALLTVAVSFAPALAMADQAISGQWRANPGHNVIIVMDVLLDNHWASETVQDNKVVAQLAGTYEQTTKSPTTGTIVWTPVKSKVTQEHGAAQVETDDYTLSDEGQTLTLVTRRTKDQMVFKKHTVQ